MGNLNLIYKSSVKFSCTHTVGHITVHTQDLVTIDFHLSLSSFKSIYPYEIETLYYGYKSVTIRNALSKGYQRCSVFYFSKTREKRESVHFTRNASVAQQ